ncbi:MAG: leucyl aminopeptidase family protein, partial [Thermocrispum sp.]
VTVTDRPRRAAPSVRLVSPAADEPPASSGPVLSDVDTPADLPPQWLPAAEVTGKAGEVHALSGPRRWLLGIGADPARPKAWRTAGGALARAVNGGLAGAGSVSRADRSVQVALPPGLAASCVRAFVLGVLLGGYRFTVSGEPADPGLHTVVLLTEQELAAPVAEAARLAAATSLARDLANAPSNVKDPAWLAAAAGRVAGEVPGVRVTVRDEAWLVSGRFGGVLAVGGGSARPPRLIELTYRPRGASPHLLLVGKGITFDTGGISLKPADGMHVMRTDMSGGAAVIAAVRAIAQAKLPVTVTALVPAAENHVSGSSYRPGDIVRHYGGTTTEVSNTDAEGRMVLADALAYGVRKYRPDVVVDVATLTGSMKVALGLRNGALFSSDDDVAGRLRAAGERVGESWWRMPLLEDHAEAVRSRIADVRQTPEGPGGITAALFLREFTGGLPWAHLDIAGAARADKAYDDVTQGGTGFGARTLVEFVAGYA